MYTRLYRAAAIGEQLVCDIESNRDRYLLAVIMSHLILNEPHFLAFLDSIARSTSRLAEAIPQLIDQMTMAPWDQEAHP